MRSRNLIIPLFLMSFLRTSSAVAQLTIGRMTNAHQVSDRLTLDGGREMFAGPWDSLFGLRVVPPLPTGSWPLRAVLASTLIGSIVPEGQPIEACRQYALIVQGMNDMDPRRVFFLGDIRDPEDIRTVVGATHQEVRLILRAADCLTYELYSAREAPRVRHYDISIGLDTVVIASPDQ